MFRTWATAGADPAGRSSLPPLVFVAGELVAHGEPVVPVEAQRRHVEPSVAPARCRTGPANHHEHGVAGRRVALAVGQQRVVVDVVKPEGAQLVQRGVSRRIWLSRVRNGARDSPAAQAAAQVAGPQLVLLVVQVLLAAAAGSRARTVRIRSRRPRTESARGQHRADLEHHRTAVLQALVQDVRRVGQKVRPHVVGVLGDQLTKLGSRPLAAVLRQVK